MFQDLIWFNEPPFWKIQDNSLSVKTGNKTDFWRKTFYGFVRNDGHFFYKIVEGDFTAAVTVIGDYKTLYDQCGLMIRINQNNWIKTGIEYTDGAIHISTVVTRDYSDWSMISVPDYTKQLTIRLTRHNSAVRIQYLDKNNNWQLIRLGYLELPEKCQIGLMCCSPEREGFETVFKDFSILEPISKQLHD
jgi:regulation of enolase protein 1 (concanavalin A-like superfamily)